ncbi:MAG TPA: ATP synthase F1 subunit gamma [Candidatus Paceibacterota bacterium]
MESVQHIKSHLGSVKSIGQITKAMEVVSATKMRRAQGNALASRDYAFAALAALTDLLRYAPEHLLEQSELVGPRHPMLRDPKHRVSESTTLVVLVASDRGLAGAFNASVGRACDAFFASDSEDSPPTGGETSSRQYKFVIVGKKLAPYAARKGYPVEMMFTGFGDVASTEEVAPLSELVVNGYKEGKWNRVVVISTHFKTTLNQFTVTREVLPMNIEQIRETVREVVPEQGRFSEYRKNYELGIMNNEKGTEYLFEPNPKDVLDILLPHLLNMQMLHLVLEANASEHSARMVAMKNASENSKELAEDLERVYNRVRQALITKEMIEITSGTI